MNKSMLYAGLMSILCTAYAENDDKNLNHVTATIQTMVANSQSDIASNSKTADIQSGQQLASQTVTPKSTEPQLPAPQGQQIPTPQGQQIPVNQGTPMPSQTQTPAAQGTTQVTTQPATSQGATTTTTTVTTTQTPPSATTTTPQEQTSTSQTTKTTPASSQPASTTVTTQPGSTTVTTQATPQTIDCNYRIPATTTKIDPSLVMKWSEKATAQSFDFDYTTMDSQLAALKACYTDLGWQGFNDALQKSGNLNAIKTQRLMVSSMVDGAGQITEIKDNQWKVSLPLQVVYQNEKEKLTQPLTINLIIGRKVSGDLGIMQMIAIPRTAANTAIPQTTTPAAVSPPPSTPAQSQ
ncbi:DotI/IcmL family type IV secretion protein [Legionella cardiaca]|uniref:DotI/IcmL family type IV secretion protein n=1 Tax=Legionella cardiaca TaxID=1071983 RepID=A0ABY8ASY8_9GAMM|nr:DotI/IcmL family type IV secretion protein [Legionella cardiaca]WED43658.1 DotI/IcmL family type IV secretion protein [Legionella cardiaca]